MPSVKHEVFQRLVALSTSGTVCRDKGTHLPRSWIELRELNLVIRHRATSKVKDSKPSTGRALVYGSNESRHCVLLTSIQCLALASIWYQCRWSLIELQLFRFHILHRPQSQGVSQSTAPYLNGDMRLTRRSGTGHQTRTEQRRVKVGLNLFTDCV